MRSRMIILVLLITLLSDGYARRRVRVHAIPSLFPPSRQSLLIQNQEVDRLGLERVRDDRHLASLVESGELVAIEVTEFVSVASTLPRNRRFVRPWVNQFLREIGAAYYSEFGVPIQVNSAVRTVKVQNRLRRVLGHTAAPSAGETASSHLAGTTVDFKRTGLTRAQLRWMQTYLYSVANRVIIEEERRCFHVMVKVVEPEPCPRGYPVEIGCQELCQCS